MFSHAHPASEADDVRSTLRDIFDNLQVDFRLRNPLGAVRTRVTDVYCPEIRRSQLREQRDVNHLDVVSCWKGLSYKQAAEIAYWENSFKVCLEETVLEALAEPFGVYLKNQGT